MGKRGPKPKPTALRILEGNPSRRELNADEPVIRFLPTMPEEVAADPLAATEWGRIFTVMPDGVYTAADEAMLAQYATVRSIIKRALAEIENFGIMIDDPLTNKDGNIVGYRRKKNPALEVWKSAHVILIQVADRLGLSPGMRSKLSIPKVSEARSKFAGLIAS